MPALSETEISARATRTMFWSVSVQAAPACAVEVIWYSLWVVPKYRRVDGCGDVPLSETELGNGAFECDDIQIAIID